MFYKRGFTLIELSIVLIIIGLIVGGVLAGRNLIDIAKRHQLLNQLNKFDQETSIFMLQYGYLPGDIKRSVAEAAGFTLVADGGDGRRHNGNGILEGYLSPFTCCDGFWAWGDQSYFFPHLEESGIGSNGSVGSSNAAAAGVGDGRTYPKLAGWEAGVFPLSREDRHLYWGLFLNNMRDPAASDLNNLRQIAPIFAFTPEEAYLIDRVIDDGMPHTGRVLSLYVLANTVTFPLNGVMHQCLTTADGTGTGATYWLANTLKRCDLMVRSQAH